jgi:hypothetical protein
MEAPNRQNDLDLLEAWTLSVGFILTGFAIGVTGVSYLVNMIFPYQWLVWIVGFAFVGVAILTISWPLALRKPKKVPPQKNSRQILILSIPLAYILSSQVCGLGFQACNAICHITNLVLVILGIVAAYRLYRALSFGWILIPMIVISLIPHCVCHAPINVLWHSMLCGVSPACEMIPLAVTLYAIVAVHGIRPRSSSVLVILLFAVMIFIIVGGFLWEFPWSGCVDHPKVID